jgi:hypothetical protein
MGLKGILVIFILITGLFVYFNIYPDYQKDPAINPSVMAFDFDGRHAAVTPQSLIDGDALIFLKVLSANGSIDFVTTLDQLKSYDIGKKGYIALDSPDFDNYYFGRYLKDKKVMEYRKLENSGIAGISLHYSKGKVESAQVILLDNSRRNLTRVQVDLDLFKEMQLKECNVKCDLPLANEK